MFCYNYIFYYLITLKRVEDTFPVTLVKLQVLGFLIISVGVNVHGTTLLQTTIR